MKTRSLVLIASWLTCASSILTLSTQAAVSPVQSMAEITQVLKTMEQALARGDDAAKVSKMLYAEDDLLVGEGEAGATRGIKDTIPDVQGWYDSLGPGGTKGCHYTIVDPVVSSPSAFTSFILLRCKANPPVLPQDQELRMLYAWKKYPLGWRVVLEMWAPGKL